MWFASTRPARGAGAVADRHGEAGGRRAVARRREADRPHAQGAARPLRLHRVRPLPERLPRMEHGQTAVTEAAHHGPPRSPPRGGTRHRAAAGRRARRPTRSRWCPASSTTTSCGRARRAARASRNARWTSSTSTRSSTSAGRWSWASRGSRRRPARCCATWRAGPTRGASPQSQRADWAEGLDVAVVNGAAPEYLYWVGCAGSFDERARDISRAVAELLGRAGVSFAILGPRELCTGDPARRMGNEFLFQTLAEQNIETMNAAGVTKVIANCPHCFNTLRNEYPQYGGNYEVIHHSELLGRLVADGTAPPDGAGRHPPRVPRPVLPGAPQPGLRRAARRPRECARRADRGDAPPQGARDVLRGRRCAHVDGRRYRQAHQRRTDG